MNRWIRRGTGIPQGLRAGFSLKLSVIIMPIKESVKALYIYLRNSILSLRGALYPRNRYKNSRYLAKSVYIRSTNIAYHSLAYIAIFI